jgi:hypothetical protein
MKGLSPNAPGNSLTLLKISAGHSKERKSGRVNEYGEESYLKRMERSLFASYLLR